MIKHTLVKANEDMRGVSVYVCVGGVLGFWSFLFLRLLHLGRERENSTHDIILFNKK